MNSVSAQRRRRIAAGLAAYLVVGLIAIGIEAVGTPRLVLRAANDFALLACLSVLLSLATIRLPVGVLNLSAIPTFAAAGLLGTTEAFVVGALGMLGRSWAARSDTGIPIGVAFATYAALGATAKDAAFALTGRPEAAFVGIGTAGLLNLAGNSLLIVLRDRSAARESLRAGLPHDLIAAFVYFGLAAALLVSLFARLGSPLAQAVVVAVLALPLTDSIAGRRWRAVLEAQLRAADAHVLFGRSVEGSVHSLRNSLAAAAGYLDMMRDAVSEPSMRADMEQANRALDDANALLDKIADVRRQARPRYMTDDLRTVATQAYDLARWRARQHQVALRMRADSSTAMPVVVDALLIREALTNLINNAIEASPEGSVVEVAVVSRPNGWPAVVVSDHGPGLAPTTLSRILGRSLSTKGSKGMGIGLATSESIARQHGGKLINESSPSAGGVFVFTIPPAASSTHRLASAGPLV